MATDADRCFWSPSRGTVIDILRPDGLTLIYNHTLEQTKAKYGDDVLEDSVGSAVDKCQELARARLCGPPIRCTKQDYYEAMGCVPPMKMDGDGSSSSFACGEYIRVPLTRLYCHLDDDSYWTFIDNAALSHNEIAKRCREQRDKNA